ncbi:MAG: ribose transport system permease protein [Thermoleophilaceae bacterium]|jgi:ribose transport system permease protein|nr:ribose transport system permease protein [Thermoleophilaceae bacterium]
MPISEQIHGDDGGGSDLLPEGPAAGTAAVEEHRGLDPKALLGRYAVVITLLVMLVVFSLLRPETFFTVGNFKAIVVTQSILIVLAIGLTIALAAGEFDLSIASMVGFTGALVAHLSSDLGWSPVAAVLLSLVVALLIGAINGVVVVYFRVNSFIATLGMGTLILGVALAITGSTVIGNLPEALTTPAREQLFGLDLPVYYALGLAIALWYFLEHTPLGRYVFFTGEGPEAARLAGVRVARIRFGALVASAFFAWLAGLLLVGQTGAADPTYGGPFLLPAFAACFLGATTIKPGRFNAWGTVVAVLLLATGTTGLQLLGAADWVENVFNGSALILAVTLAQLVSRDR